MKKRWIKVALSIMTLFAMALSFVGCGRDNGNSKLKQYLCVDHSYGEAEIERWPTCIREGRAVHTCIECGHVKHVSLDRVAHKPYTVPAREATCAQTGYTQHTACAVCSTVLSGKETIAKIACTHENDVYYGNGRYECTVCGETRTEYREYLVDDPSDVQLGYWYRFYLPTNSMAYITFDLTIREAGGSGTTAYVKVPGSEFENELYSVTFGFVGEQEFLTGVGGVVGGLTGGNPNYTTVGQDGYIWVGDGFAIETQVDAEWEIGIDYVDIYLDFSRYYGDGYGDATEIYFELTDKTPAIEVHTSGGAAIYRLDR